MRCRHCSGYDARGASAITKLGDQSGEELRSLNSNLSYTCRRRLIFSDFSESGKPSRNIGKPLRNIRKPLRKAEKRHGK